MKRNSCVTFPTQDLICASKNSGLGQTEPSNDLQPIKLLLSVNIYQVKRICALQDSCFINAITVLNVVFLL